MRIVREIAALTGLAIAAIATLGHWTGIESLITWQAGVAIKPITCWLMLVAGVMAWFMSAAITTRTRELVIVTCASLIAGSIAVNVFMLGLAPDAPLRSDQPSPVTLLACGLLAVAGHIRGIDERVHWSIWISRAAGLFGALAVLGYALQRPEFYYATIHQDWTPMSLPAAVCFVCFAVSANGKH